MIDMQAIRQRWEADGSKRDERGRRLFAAGEARAAGWGGLAAVSSITGLARSTIGRGQKELDAPPLGRESHPDRDAQFESINAEVFAAQAAGQPVISVDTKQRAGRQLPQRWQ